MFCLPIKDQSACFKLSVPSTTGGAMVCDDVILVPSTRNDPDKLSVNVVRKTSTRLDGVYNEGSIRKSGMVDLEMRPSRGADVGAKIEPRSRFR